MILSFDDEIAKIEALFFQPDDSTRGLDLAFILAGVLDKGMAMERKRALDIIAKWAINAAELRAEINRPIR